MRVGDGGGEVGRWWHQWPLGEVRLGAMRQVTVGGRAREGGDRGGGKSLPQQSYQTAPAPHVPKPSPRGTPLLFRRGQGEGDRLCVPAGGGLRGQVLHECHDSPLGGHFGREKTAALVRRVAFWPGLSDEVREYVRSCGTCQKVKADHGGPHGLLHPLPLPTRRGGTLGVDWICGLPVTAAGFDQLMVIVDLLSGKVHATPSKSTDNAATAAQTLLDHSLRSGDGVPDVLVVDHDPKFTSQLFCEFTKAIGSARIVVTACHKNTGARVERAYGVLGDTLQTLANSRRDDWDKWVLHACFAINNAPSSLGGHLSPFFIDRGAHPRLPLSLPNLSEAQETPEAYSRRVKLLEEEV